ncbi:MAG: cadherin-like beta sandwich domain-containing protein [Spirochaetes bacterium]|nr:cadherin-like beta sandwich domain-containing protein [Spirochaetota bacterium]
MSAVLWCAIVSAGVASMVCGCAALRASPGEDPRLSGLDVQATAGGASALSPAFSGSRFDYTVDVQSDIGEVAIIPRVEDHSASRISVNGKLASSGDPFAVRLAVGDNPVKVEIQDRAGRKAVYTLTINREDIRPVVDRFKKLTYRDSATGATMGYRLFVPEGYDPSRSYPLVLFLHGAGESGSDNEIHLRANQGATVWAKPREQGRHPCFVLAPQNPKDPEAISPGDFGRMGWTSLMSRGFRDPFESAPALGMAYAVLQKVMADYNVDRSRVYATGLSMGCFGVCAMNVDHPDTFAAIVAICGGLDPASAFALAKKPIWVFHATEDPLVDVRFSRDTVRALSEAGGKPRYTEYGKEVYIAPTAHQSWIPAYASAEMRDWLFEQSKLARR